MSGDAQRTGAFGRTLIGAAGARIVDLGDSSYCPKRYAVLICPARGDRVLFTPRDKREDPTTKKYLAVLALGAGLTALAGCDSFSVPPYASAPNTAISLRNLHQSYPKALVKVADFTPPHDKGKTGITCRAVGPVDTPGNQSFTQYIRTAFVDELNLAQMYSNTGNVEVSGDVDKIDFSSTSGAWIINAQVTVSNEPVYKVREKYAYHSAFFGETACADTAQAYEAAVQAFISKLISAPQFEEALKKANKT